MTSRPLFNMLLAVLIVAMSGCASPLHEGRDLGDPAPISKAPAAATVTKGEGLKVVAAPLKPSVELGEPVYLAIRVTNIGAKAVSLISRLHPDEGLVAIYATESDGNPILLAPLGDSDSSGTTRLTPGKTMGEVVPIFFGANGWNFKKPGDYRITVELKVPNKGAYSSFLSEPVTLSVKSSKAGQALFSGDESASVQAGKFLLWRSGDHLQAGIKHLTSVAERYPDSALSAYITAARVHSYSEPFANYIVKKVRPSDCKSANSLRGKIRPNTLTDNLLIEDYVAQAKCYAEKKWWKNAKKALDAAFRLSAERPEFSAYSKSVAQMQKRLRKLTK